MYYVSRYSSELGRLHGLSASGLALLFPLVILGHTFSAMKFRLSAAAFGVDLPFADALMMVESGSLVNIIPFSAMGFRALYLKKVHGLKYAHFGSGTAASLLTGFTSAGLLGMTGVFKLVFEDRLDTLGPLVGLFLAYVFGPALLFVAAFRLRKQRRNDPATSRRSGHQWHKIYHSVLDSVNTVLMQRHVLIQFLLLNLSTSLVLATRLWVVSQLLGYPFGFCSGLVLHSVGQLSAIVTVLPAGTIGLREAFIGLGAKALSGQSVNGVLISTVDRLVATCCIIVLGGVSVLVLRGRIAQAERDPLGTEG